MADKKAATEPTVEPTGNEHAGELLAELAAAEARLREQAPEHDLFGATGAVSLFRRKQAQTTPAQARELLERINEALNT